MRSSPSVIGNYLPVTVTSFLLATAQYLVPFECFAAAVNEDESVDVIPLQHQHQHLRRSLKPQLLVEEEAIKGPSGVAGSETVQCILYLLDNMQFATADDEEYPPWGANKNKNSINISGSTRHSEQWYCEFDRNYATSQLGWKDPMVELDLGSATGETTMPLFDSFDNGIESGRNALVLDPSRIAKNAVLQNPQHSSYTFKMRLDDPGLVRSIVTIEDQNSRPAATKSATTKTSLKKKKALVVRIFSHDGKRKPVVTVDHIHAAIYQNDIFSTKSQMEACSHRAIKIVPFSGKTTGNPSTGQAPRKIRKGILDLYLSREDSELLVPDGVPFTAIRNVARIATEDQLGSLEEQFDFVMFVMPENVISFQAAAIVNKATSYYTKNIIRYPPVPIHEMGHNMGLKHAGIAGGFDTGDKVGYMGYGTIRITGPFKCFNPANSFRLGWYDPQTASYEPFLEQHEPQRSRRFTLHGVDNYDPNRNDDRLVVLRLVPGHDNGDSDFYLGYNRATGRNAGTELNKGQIVVVEKPCPPEATCVTMKQDTHLKRPGDLYEIPMPHGQGKYRRSITVLLENISHDKTNAVVSVISSIAREGDTNGADKAHFRYQKKPHKDCSWVKKQRRKRCALRWKRRTVADHWCPETCRDVLKQRQ